MLHYVTNFYQPLKSNIGIGDINNCVKSQKSKFQVWRPPRLFCRLIQGIQWKNLRSSMKINHGTLPRKIWNYNRKSIFWLFSILTKTLQLFCRVVIWTFLYQICFRNKISTSGSGQTENTQIRVFAYFQFDQFPKLKINFESWFEIRMSILLF